MSKQRWVVAAAAALLLAGVGVYSYQPSGNTAMARRSMLAMMPTDASYILFADLGELRNSTFVSRLYQWAPQPQIDPDYARFLHDTGFAYERDLDRLALAIIKHAGETRFFAIADGRFDRPKIEAYASRAGTRIVRRGHVFYLMPMSAGARQVCFSFLGVNRVALTTDADLAAHSSATASAEDTRQWQERFERLAGAPVFAVVRQDAVLGDTFAAQAPGGLRSPQLATLLNQMLWVTIAGKPEGDALRIVGEGEYSEERSARQLSDVLGGMLLLAQAGLNGPDTRRHLDIRVRDAYLDIIRGTDISEIDRGETKSVRVFFDVTPKLLEAAKVGASIPQLAPADQPNADTHTRAQNHQTRGHHKQN